MALQISRLPWCETSISPPRPPRMAASSRARSASGMRTSSARPLQTSTLSISERPKAQKWRITSSAMLPGALSAWYGQMRLR